MLVNRCGEAAKLFYVSMYPDIPHRKESTGLKKNENEKCKTEYAASCRQRSEELQTCFMAQREVSKPDLPSKAAGHRNSTSAIFASHCLPSALTVHSAVGSQRGRIAKQFTT